MAVLAVVDRDTVAEPELAPDVPVVQTTQPVEVSALVALWMPAHLAGCRGRQRFVAHSLHAQPPLVADQRLDHRVTPVAVPTSCVYGSCLTRNPCAFRSATTLSRASS